MFFFIKKIIFSKNTSKIFIFFSNFFSESEKCLPNFEFRRCFPLYTLQTIFVIFFRILHLIIFFLDFEAKKVFYRKINFVTRTHSHKRWLQKSCKNKIYSEKVTPKEKKSLKIVPEIFFSLNLRKILIF